MYMETPVVIGSAASLAKTESTAISRLAPLFAMPVGVTSGSVMNLPVCPGIIPTGMTAA
jgi:hypothetical protein